MPTGTRIRIVVADPLSPSAVDLLRARAEWTVDAAGGRPRADLEGALADADALVVRSATTVDAGLIAAAPRLRVIARAGTGVDNVDVDAASARGILVMNAPGANSVSVAEHALGLMLAISRAIPAADAAMKQGVWDKKKLTGAELRGKTLGVVGFGRIGQEVAVRARSFGMTLTAHDPFLSEQVAAAHQVELLSLDDLCGRADYISLHAPVTPQTRHLFDGERLARCKRGVRIVNTARGELIDQEALVAAIERGQVAGAGLDVFEIEPPPDARLTGLRQVVATPHIAASTVEAQELVGLETAASLRDFLADGVIRNAVNFPGVPPEEYVRIRPFMRLAERMGTLVAHLSEGRTHAVGIRYYGPLVSVHGDLLASSVVCGLLNALLSSSVTLVNARALAAERGIEILETRSSRPRDFANLLSVKLHTSQGERWIEGTVFEPGTPRLALIDGVEVDAPLDGTLVVIANEDQPGVIGEVGTVLGRHGVNIANFALGRSAGGAVGVVNVDAAEGNGRSNLGAAVDELRRVAAIRSVKAVSVGARAGAPRP